MTDDAKYFQRYAQYYDLIYQDKDYGVECDFVEAALRKYSHRPVKSLLDMGCGTGNHSIPLARRGYRMTGIDLSPVMLGQAREKAKAAGLEISLHHGDIRDFTPGGKFDGCLCMFTVLGYLQETKDVLSALANARRHLDVGSLFILDVWNGLAVLRTLPSVRVKASQQGNRKLIRTVEPELDAFRHICWVNYRLLVMDGDRVIDDVEERHLSRFFFPQEIKHYLEDSGFEVLEVCSFPELGTAVNESVWTIAAVARAR